MQSPHDGVPPQVRDAFDAANAGRLQPAQLAKLRSEPLHPWIEMLGLRASLAMVPTPRGQAFLTTWQQQPVADVFRREWLAQLAQRGDWPAYLQAWDDDVESAVLRCHWLHARMATDDAGWRSAAVVVWREAANALPSACDAVMARLQRDGTLTAELRWARIDAAAAQARTGLMRATAAPLPPPQRAQALAYADYLDAPDVHVAGWPRDARSRRIALEGILRKARQDTVVAEQLLATLAPALQLSAAQRTQAHAQIALWSAVNFDAGTRMRMAALQATAFDLNLREWQAREALARGDWTGVRDAIAAMPPQGRDDARWLYFDGRAAQALGDDVTAEGLLRKAATRAEYHGFLAADRLALPYPLCPLDPPDTPAQRAQLLADDAFQRALQLHALDRPGWARREWQAAAAGKTPAQRRMMMDIAQSRGWFDRAVFGLVKVPGADADETRLYRLRFPLHHAQVIEREARRQRIDPAWVAAEIRAESVFDPQARSPADARGLMQLLPATGQAVAQRIGLPWRGGEALFDADTNIALGSAYLRQLLDAHGPPYRVIAAYNAGPTAMQRWVAQRGALEADVWIETIPYKETRDYVGRVLSFSAIYDWRLQGDAVRVSDRMHARAGSRTAFVCAASAAR